MLSEQKSSNTLDLQSHINQELVFSFTCEPEDILDIFENVTISLQSY